ncbi:MAG: hypothetical protein GXO79_16585 [Chlorobi bacterium]|nr:hypothetical protein [Chlorobiota bacterium]
MSKLNFENIIREKVEGYEMPVTSGAWAEFSKQSNFAVSGKGIFSATGAKIVLIASLFVIPALGVYFLMNFGKTERNKIFKKHIKNNTEQKIIVPTESTENKDFEIDIKNDLENIPSDSAVNEETEQIYMFTPVVKGKNIYFGPSIAKQENIKKFRMIIRDAKGRVIFESFKSSILWDGKIKGKDKFAKDGIYNWFIILIDSTDNIYRKHGKVKLIKK